LLQVSLQLPMRQTVDRGNVEKDLEEFCCLRFCFNNLILEPISYKTMQIRVILYTEIQPLGIFLIRHVTSDAHLIG